MSTRPAPMVTSLQSDAPTMARGALANVAGALLTTGLSFALVLLITHTISPHSFGLFTIASTVILLAQVPALLGLDTGAVRFVALGASADDERVARGSLQSSLLIASVSSVVLTGLLLWQASWLADEFFGKPGSAQLIRIVSLALPGLVLARVVVAGLQGFGLMSYSARLNPLRGIVNILAVLPLLALGLGATGLAWASVLTAWATLAIGIAYLLRVQPAALSPIPAYWMFGQVLRFSLPQTLTTTLLYIMLWTDIILLGRLGTTVEVATYRVAQNLLSPAQTIPTSLGQMLAPRIAAEDARGDRAVLGLMLKRVTYWNIALSLPVLLMLLLLPAQLLGLFGPRYATGATALVILAAGQMINAATGPLGQMINMSGRPYITMVNNGACAALNIAGCIILIPRYGLTGAALSTTVSITLVNLIKLVQVHTIFGVNPFCGKSVRSLAAGAVAAAVLGPPALLVSWPNAIVGVVVPGMLLLLVYAAAFWVLAAGDEERALLRQPRMLSRVRPVAARPGTQDGPPQRRRPQPRGAQRWVSWLFLLAIGVVLVLSSSALAVRTATDPKTVTLVDQTWICKGPVDLDLVSVTMTPAVAGDRRKSDAVHLRKGCTGRIGRLEVTQSAGDGVKVADGVHDLVVGGGKVHCLAKAPGLHQDGVQVLGGTRITFRNLDIDCGRSDDRLINSNLFIRKAGQSVEPPTDVVCVDCTFGSWAAHTVSVQESIRSGVRSSSLCIARYPQFTLDVGSAAIDPVRDDNTIRQCGPGEVTLVLRARSIAFGQTAKLSGLTYGQATGSPVTIERRVFDAKKYTPVTTVKTTTRSRWELVVHPGVQVTYRARLGAATSPTSVLRVRPTVTLDRRHGNRFLTRVSAARSFSGQTVHLQRQSGTRWINVRPLELGPRSTRLFTYKSRGKTSLRIVIGTTPGYLSAASKTVATS